MKYDEFTLSGTFDESIRFSDITRMVGTYNSCQFEQRDAGTVCLTRFKTERKSSVRQRWFASFSVSTDSVFGLTDEDGKDIYGMSDFNEAFGPPL